ncbi:hypothetical protein GCM10009414_02190 [Tatumella terrea]
MPDSTADIGVPGGNALSLARHLFHRISGFAALCRTAQQLSGFTDDTGLKGYGLVPGPGTRRKVAGIKPESMRRPDLTTGGPHSVTRR